jgi:hypothetical protein
MGVMLKRLARKRPDRKVSVPYERFVERNCLYAIVLTTSENRVMLRHTCAGGCEPLRSRICYVLSILRIHRPDCRHCAAQLACGIAIRERLAELNAQDERTSSANEGRAPGLRKAG